MKLLISQLLVRGKAILCLSQQGEGTVGLSNRPRGAGQIGSVGNSCSENNPVSNPSILIQMLCHDPASAEIIGEAFPGSTGTKIGLLGFHSASLHAQLIRPIQHD